MPINIFSFYHQEDEVWFQALKKQLQPFQRGSLIDHFWDKGTIEAGREWKVEMQTYIRSAQIILLFMSSDFMSSDLYDGVEMQQALECQRKGQTQIIPIILRHVHWQSTSFGALRALPTNGRPLSSWSDRDEAFFHVADEIRQILEEANASSTTGAKKREASSFPRFSSVTINDQSNRQRMLRHIYTTWISNFLEKSAHDLYIAMQECPGLLENPWSSDYEELHQLQPSPPLSVSLIQLYDTAEEELLILGNAGSGKTILLLQLTKILLERASRNETHPLPVVFHLSSWSSERLPLDEWLIDELRSKYRIPSALATRWIQTNQILPLLDGFDAVGERHREACAATINTFLKEKYYIPLIVCSRTREYSEQPIRLALRKAVVLQALVPEQIEDCLSRDTHMPEATRKFLQENTIIQELTQTPLMLQIVKEVYQNVLIHDITSIQSADQEYFRLFAQYVYRMLHRGKQEFIYSHHSTISYLAWLARQMAEQNQPLFFIEHMQFSWLPKKQEQRMNILLTLCFKLIIGLSAGILFFLTRGLLWSLLAFVAGCYLAKGKYVKGDIKPDEVVSWSWTNVHQHAFRSLLTGVQTGVLLVVSVLLLSFYSIAQIFLGRAQTLPMGDMPLDFLAQAGLFFMLGAVLLLVLESGWVSQTLADDNRTKPNQGIWYSARHSLVAGLLFGLVGGVLFSVPSNGIDTIVCGLAIGIVVGLSKGGIACLQHLFLRLQLWHNRSIPWDYARFLNYAVKHQLLRQAGGGYMFEHRMLQEHFAMLYASYHEREASERVVS